MQIDMHFYGVYAMARAAGLDPETARTVAHASQFVDDAIEDEHALIANNSAIVPTMTSHKPLDYRNALPGEQWKVWVPFHFLPGNDPKAKTFVERMVKGNEIERKRVDVKFYSDLVTKAGMKKWQASAFLKAVRIGGAEEFGFSFSWGFAHED
jgi:hypothetical protein